MGWIILSANKYKSADMIIWNSINKFSNKIIKCQTHQLYCSYRDEKFADAHHAMSQMLKH